MEQRNTYNTKQKKLIREKILEMEGDFTVKELFSELIETDESVGLTTVYRAIDKLVEEGEIIKTVGRDRTIYYRCVEKCERMGHCLLKCERCGKMEHEDCHVVEELEEHLKIRHHFLMDKKDIIIYGLCESCIKQGEI